MSRRRQKTSSTPTVSFVTKSVVEGEKSTCSCDFSSQGLSSQKPFFPHPHGVCQHEVILERDKLWTMRLGRLRFLSLSLLCLSLYDNNDDDNNNINRAMIIVCILSTNSSSSSNSITSRITRETKKVKESKMCGERERQILFAFLLFHFFSFAPICFAR